MFRGQSTASIAPKDYSIFRGSLRSERTNNVKSNSVPSNLLIVLQASRSMQDMKKYMHTLKRKIARQSVRSPKSWRRAELCRFDYCINRFSSKSDGARSDALATGDADNRVTSFSVVAPRRVSRQIDEDYVTMTLWRGNYTPRDLGWTIEFPRLSLEFGNCEERVRRGAPARRN